ncbi:MAG TPA: GRP family sugar transporter [Candidatus Nitrosotalea sp.]|nr:GRP family sugar transporter [Candidatus Nitrosotalea sp.]
MNPFGLMSSVGSAVCWGTFFVPVRKVNVASIWQLQGSTGIGVLLFAIPIGFFWGFGILPSGLFSGVIWTVGNILALYSVKLIGLSRTSPFLAGFSILVSFLWGILFFEEKFSYMILAIGAIGLLLAGLPFVTSATKTSIVQRKGYLVAAASGIIGGSYVIPMQATHTLQSGFFSSSLSIFAISLPLLILSRRWIRKEIAAGIISGSLFNAGSLFVLTAIVSIGITVAYPISQTATLFAVSWGVLYFKEIARKRNILRVVIGSVMILSGAILLSVA